MNNKTNWLFVLRGTAKTNSIWKRGGKMKFSTCTKKEKTWRGRTSVCTQIQAESGSWVGREIRKLPWSGGEKARSHRLFQLDSALSSLKQ